MNNQLSTINNSWETVIGVEVHVETNTKSKMFCGCSADYFGAKPNTHTCPVCLGLPGALPYINQEALEKCMQIGLALGCEIREHSLFERKNYFYPDLPKGYQISQYRWPLCVNGSIEIDGDDGEKIVRINRAHQEEDTGKLTHVGTQTFIDFNRSGLPLVEIVTEPDFRSSKEVRDYAKKLQQIIKSIGVSDANMERGDMRLEANVSVRQKGQKDLPNYRVELKNINSFKFIGDAIDYEVERQIRLLEKGEKITLQTRGYNENKKETFLQRVKEEANDYRYFPEPDLPALLTKKADVDRISASLPKLPEQKIQELALLGVPPISGATLVRQGMDVIFNDLAPKAQEIDIDARATANFIINKINEVRGKTIEELITDMKAIKSGQIADKSQLDKLAKEAIGQNPQSVSAYKAGKTNAIQVLIGSVMKKTRGMADAKKVKIILEQLLK